MANDYPQLTRLASIVIQSYERYLPSAFDDSLSFLQKINRIEEFVNNAGTLINSAVDLIELAITTQDLDIVALQGEVVDFRESISLQQSNFENDVTNTLLPANLDVILSTWFDSGRLGTIINTTIYEEIDSRYKTLNAKIDSQTSGSPKGVYATLIALQSAFPVGNSNIYVVSADGKWYYWSGTAWVAGGIYQATGIDQSLRNTTISLLNIPTLTNKMTNGNFVDVTGWSSASSYGRASVLTVANNTLSVKGSSTSGVGARSLDNIFELNKKYYVKIKARVTNPNCTVMQLKQGDVSGIASVVYPVQNQWYEMDGILNVTSVVHTFLHFFHQYSDASTALDKVMEVQYVDVIDLTSQYGVGLEPNLIDFRKTISYFSNSFVNGTESLFNAQKVLDIIKPIPNNIITISPIKDYFTNKSTVVAQTNIDPNSGNATANVLFSATDFILVDPLTPYVFNRNDNKIPTTGNMAFYDEAKKYISGQQSIYEFFTTPAKCRYIRVSIYNITNFDLLTLQIGTKAMPVVESSSLTDIYGLSRFKGKKWVGIGDSITQKSARATLNYHDFVKQELGLEFVNLGLGGTGYKKGDTSNTSFYQRILTDLPVDGDIVTMFGGINDALFNTAEIGVATDIGTTTWCGCVNKAIDNLESKMLHVPLGIITPLPCEWVNTNESAYFSQRPNDVNSRVRIFADQLIEIGKLRGYPVLDLFRESGLRPWVADVNLEYFSCGDSPNGDGLHPNSKGHKMIYRKVLEFVKTLAHN